MEELDKRADASKAERALAGLSAEAARKVAREAAVVEYAAASTGEFRETVD